LATQWNDKGVRKMLGVAPTDPGQTVADGAFLTAANDWVTTRWMLGLDGGLFVDSGTAIATPGVGRVLSGEPPPPPGPAGSESSWWLWKVQFATTERLIDPVRTIDKIARLSVPAWTTRFAPPDRNAQQLTNIHSVRSTRVTFRFRLQLDPAWTYP